MAYDHGLFDFGQMVAAANYSSGSHQFTFMYTTGGGKFKKQVTNGGWVLGVLQDSPSSGFAGSIRMHGITKLRFGGSHAAIVPGDKICCSTAGTGIPSTTVAKYAAGRALEALASNTSGIIAVWLNHAGAGSSAAAAGV